MQAETSELDKDPHNYRRVPNEQRTPAMSGELPRLGLSCPRCFKVTFGIQDIGKTTVLNTYFAQAYKIWRGKERKNAFRIIKYRFTVAKPLTKRAFDYHYITNDIEQSPSSAANVSSANQELPRLL
jgi:hypothetical protein